MIFNKITKNDESHAEVSKGLAELAASNNRFPYNALVSGYNELQPEEHITFDYAKSKASQLVAQLGKRGLVRDRDYSLVIEAGEEGSTDTAFITRVSTLDGNMVQSSAGRRPMTAEEKAERAAKREAAKKGKGKGK